MGSNNGTGQPNWFRCTKCRSTIHGGDGGWTGDVDLAHKAGEHVELLIRDGVECLPSYATKRGDR